MVEYGSYGNGLGEDGDELEAAVATRASEGVDVVDSFQKGGPFEVRKP